MAKRKRSKDKPSRRRRSPARVARPPLAPAQLFEEASRLHQQGRLEDAAKLYRQLLTSLPGHPQTLHRLGVVHFARQEYDRAAELIVAAIARLPDRADFHNNLGNVLKAQGKLGEAAKRYAEALRLRPAYRGACENLDRLALELYSQGRPAESLRWLVRIVENSPEFADAHAHLGAVLSAHHRFGEAARSLRDALRLEPDHPAATFNLGVAELALGHHDEAQHQLERALELRPDEGPWRAHLCQLRSEACDWSQYDPTVADLTRACERCLESDSTDRLPLQTLQRFPLPPALTAAVTRKEAERIERRMRSQRHRSGIAHPPPAASQRLRIGYVSADFRKHPVGWLVRDLFGRHDRESCEIHGYGLVPVDDVVTKQIRRGCDAFTSLSDHSALQAAQRIHADGIQILVDLTGYTTHCRPEIFALRPAPVQAHYLGYLSTMGADFIDYVIADDVVIRPEDEAHYTEQIVRLPEGFCAASALPMSREPMARQDVGLPDDAIVFCSLNNPYKIDPATYALWMEILERVPRSVLWLAEPEHPAASDNLRASAARAGIEPSRVLFAPRIPLGEHLTRSALADLFLDTLLYNAGATAVGVLQAGVPVLTVPGETFLSRMGASLLQAAGMAELVCSSRHDYVERAVGLATHPSELAAARRRLSERRTSAPLFDVDGWARRLEAAYCQMWQHHLAGGPQPIRLSACAGGAAGQS